MRRVTRVPFVMMGAFLLAGSPSAAYAYVGPGLGLGVLGAVLGLIASVALALVGLIWYPVKRLLRERRNRREAQGEPAPESPPPAASEGSRADDGD
jgi:hypothetical protein